MRISVTGSFPTASGLRGLLQSHDFHIVDHMPSYAIEIEEVEHSLQQPIVDGVDSEFERLVVAELAEQAGSVLIQRAGGVRREDKVKITLETNEHQRFFVQRAVYRALCRLRKDKKPWFGRD